MGSLGDITTGIGLRQNSVLERELRQGETKTCGIHRPFDSKVVKHVTKKMNPQRAAGQSGLRFSHLQEALNDGLALDFAGMSRLVYADTNQLQLLFLVFHTSLANLPLPGTEARPVECRDTSKG